MSTRKFFVITVIIGMTVFVILSNDWWVGVLYTDPYHFPPSTTGRVEVGVISFFLSSCILLLATGVLLVFARLTGLNRKVKRKVKRMMWRRRFRQYFGCSVPRTEQEGQLLQALVYQKLSSYADRFRDCREREEKMLKSTPVEGEGDAVLKEYRRLRTELFQTKGEFWAAHKVASEAPGITVQVSVDHYR